MESVKDMQHGLVMTHDPPGEDMRNFWSPAHAGHGWPKEAAR